MPTSIKDHILIVLRGADRPLCAFQIARVLNRNTSSISSQISKLRYYGQIELAQVRGRGGNAQRFYRPKDNAA